MEQNKKSAAQDHSVQKTGQEEQKPATPGGPFSKTESYSPCPTNEELANIIMRNNVLKKEGEIGYHVANCDKCFREWVRLSQLIGTMEKTTQKRSPFSLASTPGCLATIVLGLVITACLVFFFSITP
jgi:hypothetical protein